MAATWSEKQPRPPRKLLVLAALGAATATPSVAAAETSRVQAAWVQPGEALTIRGPETPAATTALDMVIAPPGYSLDGFPDAWRWENGCRSRQVWMGPGRSVTTAIIDSCRRRSVATVRSTSPVRFRVRWVAWWDVTRPSNPAPATVEVGGAPGLSCVDQDGNPVEVEVVDLVLTSRRSMPTKPVTP